MAFSDGQDREIALSVLQGGVVVDAVLLIFIERVVRGSRILDGRTRFQSHLPDRVDLLSSLLGLRIRTASEHEERERCSKRGGQGLANRRFHTGLLSQTDLRSIVPSKPGNMLRNISPVRSLAPSRYSAPPDFAPPAPRPPDATARSPLEGRAAASPGATSCVRSLGRLPCSLRARLGTPPSGPRPCRHASSPRPGRPAARSARACPGSAACGRGGASARLTGRAQGARGAWPLASLRRWRGLAAASSGPSHAASSGGSGAGGGRGPVGCGSTTALRPGKTLI